MITDIDVKALIIEEDVIIEIVIREEDLCEFLVTYGDYVFRIQSYQYKLDDTLLLTAVDIEGPGPNTFGRGIHHVINLVCDQFCCMFETERIIILGAKRTVGKTQGTFFRPVYRNKRKL